MKEEELLKKISAAFQAILGNKLTGIYVHGSIPFGCFRWEVSDIDFLVVVSAPPEQDEKEKLIRVLLDLDPEAPPKGLEMSVVLDSVCKPFCYPTPFELHFSNAHKAWFRADVTEYCRTMHGTDPDLAAHLMVIQRVGTVLCGKAIETVFDPVPRADYLDSIRKDIGDALEGILKNPIYYILNLCRVLAYAEEELVLSKEQGGVWGIEKLGNPIIRSALAAYTGKGAFQADEAALTSFADRMLKRIQNSF